MAFAHRVVVRPGHALADEGDLRAIADPRKRELGGVLGVRQHRLAVAAKALADGTGDEKGGERNETRFPGYFVEALGAEAADRDRNGRVSVLEAFDFAKTRVEESYKQGGHILTEHAALDDGSEGKFAGALYLAPPRSRSTEMANADPKLRALLEEREALEREIASLQQRKNSLEAAAYEQQLEKLLTDLALKSRAIRELEAKK